MDNISQYVDYGRVVAVSLTAIILLLGVVIPIYKTFIPYWQKFGKPSLVMLSRLATRFMLFVLAIYNLSFPAERLLIGHAGQYHEYHRGLAIPIYLALSLVFLYSWRRHPDGWGGL